MLAFIQSVGPQVLLVEEAGQVLEAHILTSLVPSGMSDTLAIHIFARD